MDPGSTCLRCQTAEPEPGYRMPLCAACRDALVRYPLPGWFWLGVAVTAFVMIISLARLPAAIEACQSYDQGCLARDSGRWVSATEHFQRTVQLYPNSVPALVELVTAACRAERPDLVAKYGPRLEGQEVPKESAQRLEAALAELSTKVKQEPKP